MITPYLTFHGNCEEAFHFYAEAFGGGETKFVRLNNDPNNPIMHASVSFTKYEGCIMGADVDEPVIVSGMAICVVLPTKEAIEEVLAKMAVSGIVVQGFLPHPPPDDHDGGAEVIDQYGFRWCFST